jgi:uncharacterized protein with GYD domain
MGVCVFGCVCGTEFETRRFAMETFISLVGFTDQGIRAVRQTVARAEALLGRAYTLGVTV